MKKMTAKESMRKDQVQLYVLLAPFMLVFLVFTVAPVIVTFILSLTQYNVLQPPRFIGLDNFKNLFSNDPIFLTSVKNTIVYAVITGPVGYMLCFFVAWAISTLNRYIRAVLVFLFYLPALTGAMLFTIWNGVIFSGDVYGYMNSFLMRFGLTTDPIQWFSTQAYILPLIIVVQLWLSLGTGFLAMVAGITSIDRQYYEAGAIDGVKSRLQEIRYITLPMMAPHLMTAAVLQITAMFANAAIAQNLAGFPSTNYAGHLIMTHLNDYSAIRAERGYASAIAVLLFIFMITLNRTIMRALKKVSD